MHTLSRAITAEWFTTPDDFHRLRRHWRTLLNSDRRHTLTAEHHLLYSALLGRDWRRGFTLPRRWPPEGFAYWRLFLALRRLHSPYLTERWLAPFDGGVTPAMLAALRRWLINVDATTYPLEHYQPGAFPFEPYAAPAAPQTEAEYV